MPKRVPSKLRQIVIERAKNRCEYCQSLPDFSSTDFETDHILPISAGGTNEFNNLARACGGCNGNKNKRTSGIDPVDEKVYPLFNPRTQIWNDHFVWSEDATHMVG